MASGAKESSGHPLDRHSVGRCACSDQRFLHQGHIVDISTLKGREQWHASVKERELARSEGRWADLVDWSVTTAETLGANPEFAEMLKKHQSELRNDVAASIEMLLAKPPLPDARTEECRKLLKNLVSMNDWNLPAIRLLLIPQLVKYGSCSQLDESFV